VAAGITWIILYQLVVGGTTPDEEGMQTAIINFDFKP
jgi:hypothetical protein